MEQCFLSKILISKQESFSTTVLPAGGEFKDKHVSRNVETKTDEEKLKILFHRYNPLDVQVSRRLDKGKYLSMGYGFVKLKSEADCMSVIKTLQGNAFLKNPSPINGMF